ncbi:MAG TPA: BREX system ATP-binding domain-containing protein, partial [Polyangiaceae bacterium]
VSAPHQRLVDLVPSEASGALPEVRVPERSVARELRALIRAASGLPPTEAVPSLSVGYEKIERTIEGLLELSALRGSVFSLLVGAYGSGKTHLLLHLGERALEDGRPVLRLAVEQLDPDIGQPQRHLRRLLEDSTLPLAGRPSMMDLLHSWTNKPARTDGLLQALERLSTREDEIGENASRILRAARRRRSPARALEALLGARDLATKTAARGNRAAAYGRLLLWLTLLEELEGLKGPVLFIDEAENLYRGGVTRAERRTALRSLAFYCSGVIASGCVVLALTPEAGKELAEECSELLGEVGEQSSTLPWEDASMLRRRLLQTKPIAVPALKADAAQELAQLVRKVHRAVRGPVRAPGIDALVADLSRARANPRVIVRSVVDHLENAWWTT